MIPVVVALGSNIGDCRLQLVAALGRVSQWVRYGQASGLYESAPMYTENQPRFLNAVLVGQTRLGPFGLLDALKRVEQELGRTAREPNGPREIDLDLVSYGSLILRSERLVLPHPRAAERRFVLLPWLEADPEARLTGWGRVDELLSRDKVSHQDVMRIVDAVVPIRGL